MWIKDKAQKYTNGENIRAKPPLEHRVRQINAKEKGDVTQRLQPDPFYFELFLDLSQLIYILQIGMYHTT